MDRTSLESLLRYNAYANDRVLQVAGRLTPEDFTRSASPSHDSVRQLLQHFLETEAFFLALAQGRPWAEPPGLMTLADLERYACATAAEGQAYLAGLSAADLERPLTLTVRGQALNLSVWQAFVQVVLHATQHRGELSIILTQLGQPLPTMDILLYFIQESGQAWPGR